MTTGKYLLMMLMALVIGTSHAEAKKQKVKKAETAEQFMLALENDTRIVIPAFTMLKLSDALGNDGLLKNLNMFEFDVYADSYGTYGMPTLGWSDQNDGKELDIAGFSNLTIEGEGQGAGIIVEPRYAYVLSFFNCKDITLRNLTLGHTDTGYCEGGVVRLTQCANSRIENCDLYGCGTEGIGAENSTGLVCLNSIIRDCSYQIMTIKGCKDFAFTACDFHDCREFTLLNILYCENVSFSSCKIHDNDGTLFNIHGQPITMQACQIFHNPENIGNSDMAIMDANTVFTDQTLASEHSDEEYDEVEEMENMQDYTDWDWDEKPLFVPADVAKPDIRDFVAAACLNTRSPLMQSLGAAVRMPGNSEFDALEIDVPNGYVLAGFGNVNHLEGDYRVVECCYWRMDNGHSLFAINQLLDYDALAIRFYDYDPKTHVLTPRPDITPYQGIPDDLDCRQVLPHVGKSMQLFQNGNIYHQVATQTWNGKQFVLQMTDKAMQFGGTPHLKGGEFDMISFIKKYYPNAFATN